MTLRTKWTDKTGDADPVVKLIDAEQPERNYVRDIGPNEALIFDVELFKVK